MFASRVQQHEKQSTQRRHTAQRGQHVRADLSVRLMLEHGVPLIMTDCVRRDLDANQLTGTIPSSLGSPPNMTLLCVRASIHLVVPPKW